MSNHLNVYQISRLLFIGEIRPLGGSVSIIDIRRGAPLGLGGGGGRARSLNCTPDAARLMGFA